MSAQPLKDKLDYADLAHAPDDGHRYELLDGDLFVTPAPSPLHQRVSKRLQRQLEAYFEDRGLGEVFNAPLDVILTPRDVVQPDLAVVTNPSQVSKRGIEGAPAIVVEILSPSTAERDRTLKARRYAATGIQQYWIVDIERQRVECHRASAGCYVLAASAEGAQPLLVPEWPGLGIDLGQLWR